MDNDLLSHAVLPAVVELWDNEDGEWSMFAALEAVTIWPLRITRLDSPESLRLCNSERRFFDASSLGKTDQV